MTACELTLHIEAQDDAIRARNAAAWGDHQAAIEQRMEFENECYFTAAGALGAVMPPCFSAVGGS